MSHSFPSPLRLFGLVLSLVVNAQGQGVYCNFADVLARTNLEQDINIKTCAAAAGGTAELATCQAQTMCVAGCSVNTAELAFQSCTDGCTYTSGGYTVSRNFTGGYTEVSGFGFTNQVIRLGYSHTFIAGPAQGTFIYSYSGTLGDDLRTVPKLGGTCRFSFNGVECKCSQFYCNAAQTEYENRIDCSAVPGGAVIDLCKGVTIPTALSNKTLSLLEILYAVPGAVCSGKSIDGRPLQPSTPTGQTPVKAPVKAPSPPSPIGPPKAADAPIAATVPTPVPSTPVFTPNASGPSPPSPGSSPSTDQEYGKCGLFKLSLFCLNGCGLIRRVLGLCD